MVDKIPTSRDVLAMQAAASRCASLITLKLDELVLDERDPLSFLLHDLVHAYKMFSDTKLLQGNLNSLRCLLNIHAFDRVYSTYKKTATKKEKITLKKKQNDCF